MTPRYTIILSEVLVSSVVGTSSSLPLNFTTINAQAFGRAACMPGVDACLIEEEGAYPPAR